MGKSLGEGTFGKVKLGTHILTGEKVAIKVLEKSRIKDYKDVERINREIKILKQVHHPNVVQLYEIIETEKELYLIMEFVYGGELFDYIVSHQRLKEKVASKLFQEMVSALNYIHSIGICHRDLKPENILLCYDKTIKIVDFGLSNMYKPGELLKTACGSPCYAAPEMIAGQKYYGLKSDLWSAGVVLYAMLCGFLPYEDQKTSNLYKKIMSADYTMPKFLSPDAQQMIDSLFQTDPSKRINVQEIRKHPFYCLHTPETASFGITRALEDPTKVNQKILAQIVEKFSFSEQSVLKAIATNRHNHMTATYYLLLKKQFMAEKRAYAESFMEQGDSFKFREVKQKSALRETKEVFEKTAGSVDPSDLVKFSQRGERVAHKVGMKAEKRGQSQDPNRQRRAAEEYYRDAEIEENARRRGDSAQRADPEEEMGILTSKINKDRDRSRSKQREYIPQQFIDQRQTVHSAVSHQPGAKLNSRNEAHTLQELSPESEMKQRQSRGVESLLQKLNEEITSPTQNRSFVAPKSNYAQVIASRQPKDHMNIVSQYCAPSGYEQRHDYQEVRAQSGHRRAKSFNETQSLNKSSYQTQQSSQKYSVEQQISSPGSNKEVSKVLKLAQNTENLKKLMKNVTNIGKRNGEPSSSAQYSTSGINSTHKRGHVRGKSDIPQQLSFLDRVPQMHAYQNGEQEVMQVKQNNYVEPNLEMTSISLKQEQRPRGKRQHDELSERLSNSKLANTTGTVASKENSELDSLKNTQLIFQGGKVQAGHKKNRTQFIDPSSHWTNSSNGVIQDLSQSVLLSKNSPPKTKPKHSNQELAKFMNQPLSKGTQVLDSTQNKPTHSRNHSNSSTQNKKKSYKPTQRTGQSQTYSSSQRNQPKHTRTRSHGQQQTGPQTSNSFNYNGNAQPQASFDLNINISALYRQYQQIKRNSKQYNRSSQAKAAPAKSQMNNSMGQAIADNTIAAIDFMNKTFNYGTTTSHSRASANQTRTEMRSKPVSNILSMEQQNSRSAALNSSYGPDYKKKKSNTQTGTQVKNSVQGTQNLFNTTQNYVGGVVPPPSYKQGSGKKGRKGRQ